MNAEELLRLIQEYQVHVRQGLSAEEFNALREALAELARAGEDKAKGRRALQRVRLALLPLPLDSLVRKAATDATRRDKPEPLVLAPDSTRELLRQLAGELTLPDPDDAVRDVVVATRRRLLAEPSRSAAELDSGSAADPEAAGLIRLVDPERGARFPKFQFAPEGGGPLAVVQRVNRLLLAGEDPWGAADWWLGGNSWLGGTPAELIGQVPDELLAEAAQALVEED